LRRAVILTGVLSVAVGCTGSTVPPTSSHAPSPLARSRAARPNPSIDALPALTLRADLGDQPAAWGRVTFIPFGERREQLGYKTFPTGPASQPSAFAVAPDGSIWIDDRWKRRVVHYSPSGAFLGSAGRLEHPGWDLAIVGEQVFVLVEQSTGTIGTVEGSEVKQAEVIYGKDPLFIIQLIPTARGLVAEAAGVAGTRPGELETFVSLDPLGSIGAEVIPGLPLGRGDVSFNATRSQDPVHPHGDQDFDLTFTSGEVTQAQPIQFDLIVHDGRRERAIPAEVGLLEPLPMGDDVLMYVRVAPARPEDAGTYGDGRWLLRVGRSPLLWERLPEPDTTDELHHRHLAIGPGGAIYLMVTKRDGMLILRRPGTGG
jgi:hypothetical protein